jgi:tetratricopeptide (TPR) repeat protein
LLVGFQTKMIISTKELDFQRYLKVIERVLKILKSIDNPKQLGIAHYNLSNSLANVDEKSRLKHLRRAGQLNSDYLTRSYYFSELGSTLFNLRRYRLSATSYQKALSLDKRGESVAFYADALLHCGKYEQALGEFQNYLKQCEENQVKINALWYLKFIVLQNLVSKTGVSTQKRETLKARELSLSATSQPQAELRKTLEAALQLDLVCSDAWHNLGNSYGIERDSEKALSFFACSLLTHTKDIESWMCVFLHALNVDNILYATYAITGAHIVFGNNFLKAASNFIASQTDPSFPKNEMMNALLSVSRDLPNDDKPLTVRILNENGSYEVLESQST